MGVFVPIPGACKIELLGRDTISLKPIVNVLHASCGTAPTAADLTNIANAIKGVYGPPGSNNTEWPDTYILDSIQVTDLNTSTGPQVNVNVNLAGTGGDGIPSVAGTALFDTNLRGRSFRGRAFFPIAETNVTTNLGEVTSTYVTNMHAILAAIDAAITALGGAFALVVVSRKLRTWQPITSFFVRLGIGYIRRRLFG